MRKSEEDQCALIRDLADTCCCIAVKTGQYVKTVAESVKRAADEVGLPVLEIPGELAYIDIIVDHRKDVPYIPRSTPDFLLR